MKTRNMVKNTYRANYQFIDSAVLNNDTYWDYLHRLEKIATSIFEWVNLPSSMDSRYLEKTLFFFGKATLLKDKTYGFINTRCCGGGDINIYGLPTQFECFSYGYSSKRKLYTGLDPLLSDKQKEVKEYQECILVPNNMDFLPTASTLELYAYRLYTAEQTAFINIIGQRHPIMILCDEKQTTCRTCETDYMLENGTCKMSKNKEKGSNAGVIAGCVVAVFVVLFVASLFCVF